jgi:hypothetical protein
MRKKQVTEAVIGDKYKLATDAYNIILMEKNIRERDKVEYWVNIAYFSSWEHALEEIVRRDIKEAWVKDLEYVVKEIARLDKMIQGLRGTPMPELL